MKFKQGDIVAVSQEYGEWEIGFGVITLIRQQSTGRSPYSPAHVTTRYVVDFFYPSRLYARHWDSGWDAEELHLYDRAI